VRKGRGEEFAAFGWKGEVPDPQAETTFLRCKLNHALALKIGHQTLRDFHRELLALRKQMPAIGFVEKENLETTPFEWEGVLMVRQWSRGEEIVLLFNFAGERRSLEVPLPDGPWRKRLDSADRRWGGSGPLAPAEISSGGRVRLEVSATTVLLYHKTESAEY